MSDNYRRFYEQVGEHYPEDTITYSSISGLLRRKWISEKMNRLGTGNLLDCGCNTGRLSAGWRSGAIYGIDIAHSVLTKGRKLFPATNFIQADLRDLDCVKSNTIENAIACEVVEHIDQPMVFLKELYRVLKPGARFIITVPGYTRQPPKLIPIGIMRSFGLKTGTTGDLYLHTAYRPDELARLIADAGFRIIEQGSFERELRYWQKPLNMIEAIYDRLAAYLCPSSKLNIICRRGLEHFKINMYNILDCIGVIRVITKNAPHGRRSYALAEK